MRYVIVGNGRAGTAAVEGIREADPVSPTPVAEMVVEAAAPEFHQILDEAERADHLAAIDAASDLAELKRAYSTAYSAAKQAGDVDALNDFERAKDARKAQLTEAA